MRAAIAWRISAFSGHDRATSERRPDGLVTPGPRAGRRQGPGRSRRDPATLARARRSRRVERLPRGPGARWSHTPALWLRPQSQFHLPRNHPIPARSAGRRDDLLARGVRQADGPGENGEPREGLVDVPLDLGLLCLAGPAQNAFRELVEDERDHALSIAPASAGSAHLVLGRAEDPRTSAAPGSRRSSRSAFPGPSSSRLGAAGLLAIRPCASGRRPPRR